MANDTDDKDQRGGTLEDIATSIGTLLGKAERRWRESGASEAIEKTVTDLRDRAAKLVDEINAARTSSATPPPQPAAAAPPPAPPKAARRVARKATKQAVKREVKKAVRNARPARKARARSKR